MTLENIKYVFCADSDHRENFPSEAMFEILQSFRKKNPESNIHLVMEFPEDSQHIIDEYFDDSKEISDPRKFVSKEFTYRKLLLPLLDKSSFWQGDMETFKNLIPYCKECGIKVHFSDFRTVDGRYPQEVDDVMHSQLIEESEGRYNKTGEFIQKILSFFSRKKPTKLTEESLALAQRCFEYDSTLMNYYFVNKIQSIEETDPNAKFLVFAGAGHFYGKEAINFHHRENSMLFLFVKDKEATKEYNIDHTDGLTVVLREDFGGTIYNYETNRPKIKLGLKHVESLLENFELFPVNKLIETTKQARTPNQRLKSS